MRLMLPLVATLAVAAPTGLFKRDGVGEVSKYGNNGPDSNMKRDNFQADSLLQVDDNDTKSSYARSNFEADPLLKISDNPLDSSYN
ncbi:hypothetical protein NOR_05785 [Metarhizium rileyi]|uniref:Uncharacterized protein n=1 Tax=Metarhizium rileyi (strain RCEF 4871) TaxID=1649241 RepID=A0A167C2E2_METRR|nr:hypothetical protein NOR_05785 [Metarhizium rileyi RCEF 4871]